jgi:hypothetical protein
MVKYGTQLFVDNVDHIYMADLLWHGSKCCQNVVCFSVDFMTLWSTVGAVDSKTWQKRQHWPWPKYTPITSASESRPYNLPLLMDQSILQFMHARDFS